MPEFTDEEIKALKEKAKAEGEAAAKAALKSELERAKAEGKAEVEKSFRAELKAVAGVDSLSALKKEKAAADKKRLEEEGRFKELAEEAAKERDAAKSERDQALTDLKRHRIEIALSDAANQAGAIDAEVIRALLGSKAEVGEDGKVTIDGKDAAEAVKEFLKEKPHLAKAEGQKGSEPGDKTGDDKGEEISTEEYLGQMFN